MTTHLPRLSYRSHAALLSALSIGLVRCASTEPEDELLGHAELAIQKAAVEFEVNGPFLDLHGQAAVQLFAVMKESGQFSSSAAGGVKYQYGKRIACASDGTDASCYVVSSDVRTPNGEYAFTFRGHRSDSAASELFNAIAVLTAADPATATEVFAHDYGCQKLPNKIRCGLMTEPTPLVSAAFSGLPELGADFVYEGWLITPTGPVSAGRFSASEQSAFAFEVPKAVLIDTTTYVLTIEPAVNDLPTPSKTHVLAGDFTGGSSHLSIVHAAALGTDFSSAAGQFMLQTPTTPDVSDDWAQGIWYVIPGQGVPSLALPTLPQGWTYEGWVVGANGPVSTGTFTSVAGADSDGAGVSAGPAGGPPFPGQDFISPPMSLPGGAAVISIEPVPDFSPTPFAIKPLAGSITAAGAGVLQDLLPQASDAVLIGDVTLVF